MRTMKTIAASITVLLMAASAFGQLKKRRHRKAQRRGKWYSPSSGTLRKGFLIRSGARLTAFSSSHH